MARSLSLLGVHQLNPEIQGHPKRGNPALAKHDAELLAREAEARSRVLQANENLRAEIAKPKAEVQRKLDAFHRALALNDASHQAQRGIIPTDYAAALADREKRARETALRQSGDWFLNWCDRAGVKVEESAIRQALERLLDAPERRRRRSKHPAPHCQLSPRPIHALMVRTRDSPSSARSAKGTPRG